MVPDKDLPAEGALYDSGAGWSSLGILHGLEGALVAAPQREGGLFLFPKITVALSDGFLCLVKNNTLHDFKHYL